MQKLSAKLKNTPRDTSLVPCSVSSVLNKEETLSVQNICWLITSPKRTNPDFIRRCKLNISLFLGGDI